MSTRIIIALLILLGAYAAISYDKKEAAVPVAVACTEEAKRCSDGSFVARVAPSCEFAACPVVKKKVVTPPDPSLVTITGIVKLVPGCGVQPVEPIPACEYRPYATTIDFTDAYGHKVTTTSDESGAYTIKLPIATYTIKAKSGDTYPQCDKETLVVEKSITHDIICNSGFL